jgi:hypothetical protein
MSLRWVWIAGSIIPRRTLAHERSQILITIGMPPDSRFNPVRPSPHMLSSQERSPGYADAIVRSQRFPLFCDTELDANLIPANDKRAN